MAEVVLQLRTVDVFTDRRFTGNPLGVVLDADTLTTEQMQAIARELNLSETTFVLQPTAPGADYRIRIFTPASELPFAGHPSVGTAFLLAEEGRFRLTDAVTVVHQQVELGVLPLEIHSEAGRPLEVVMTQGEPQLREVWGPEEVERLASALRIQRGDLRDDLPVQVASTGVPSLHVPLRDIRTLSRLAPDLRALRELPWMEGLTGVYTFVVGEGVRARFFAPELGIGEDPATGSAAGALGAYLYHHRALPRADTALVFTIEQGVEMGRPSRIEVEVKGHDLPEVVRVGGQAVAVSRGEIRVG